MGFLINSTNGAQFKATEALWNSFLVSVDYWINHNGGVSTPETPTIKRPNWSTVKDVMNGVQPLSSLGN